MKILIKNGRVIDPANQIDEQKNIFVENGRLVESFSGDADRTIDAEGLWVTPGLIDMHVHLREPGQTHKETIKTGTLAAAAGGFATVCCMPNTSPVIESRDIVEYILKKSCEEGAVRVLPVGSITKGLLGEELSDIAEMHASGICAISDDGKTVENAELFKSAMMQAKDLNLPILSHCEPEEEIIARDIKLARETGARLHICHVSTAASVELIREAISAGQEITAEVAPHHFTLTKDDHDNDANFKMAPPLRTRADIDAILAALKDGTIGVIATDHAPHHANEKSCPYENAANGIIGLETAVPLAISELVKTDILSPFELIKKFTANPAKILGLDLGHLSVGATADITIINPHENFTIDKNFFHSLSRNTPFNGRKATGRVVYTIVEGKFAYDYRPLN
jgi:dihydroorotase